MPTTDSIISSVVPSLKNKTVLLAYVAMALS